MGFLDKLLTAGGVVVMGVLAKTAYAEARETARRRNSPLSFDDGVTQSDFVEIARDMAKHTPRVENVTVRGMTVTLDVRSNSGLSKWTAEVDFNDYGRLTGKYWLKTDTESLVPEHFARAVQKQIAGRLKSSDVDC